MIRERGRRDGVPVVLGPFSAQYWLERKNGQNKDGEGRAHLVNRDAAVMADECLCIKVRCVTTTLHLFRGSPFVRVRRIHHLALNLGKQVEQGQKEMYA